MRIILCCLITLFSQAIFAQNEPATTADEKIYLVVDEMPRFPGCEVGIMTPEERHQCAEKSMLQYIYSNITYPDSARIKGTEGKVVIQFVVEKTGRVNQVKLLKDIGDGCGEEAMRVVNSMREQNIYWRPGMKDSTAVNVRFTLPVSFKLEEYTPPPPYTVYEGDTIYIELQKMAQFKEGDEALKLFLATETAYPESGLDSCLIGELQSDILVRTDGSVQLINTTDYSNLGTDFLFEVIKLVPKMENKWTPATYADRAVNSIYPVRVQFHPNSAGCKSIITNYEKELKQVNEAVTLHDNEKSAEALLLMDKALGFFPNNTEWLYFRGVMHLSLGDNESACADFEKIRSLLGVAWYEKWIDVVCGF